MQCVIAKSFAFIYSRNQPNFGLLGITMTDEGFFEAAQDGVDIKVDLGRNVVVVDGMDEFPFEMSRTEKDLIGLGGITPAFTKFGKQLFQGLCSSHANHENGGSLRTGLKQKDSGACSSGKGLDW